MLLLLSILQISLAFAIPHPQRQPFLTSAADESFYRRMAYGWVTTSRCETSFGACSKIGGQMTSSTSTMLDQARMERAYSATPAAGQFISAKWRNITREATLDESSRTTQMVSFSRVSSNYDDNSSLTAQGTIAMANATNSSCTCLASELQQSQMMTTSSQGGVPTSQSASEYESFTPVRTLPRIASVMPVLAEGSSSSVPICIHISTATVSTHFPISSAIQTSTERMSSEARKPMIPSSLHQLTRSLATGASSLRSTVEVSSTNISSSTMPAAFTFTHADASTTITETILVTLKSTLQTSELQTASGLSISPATSGVSICSASVC